MAADVEEKIFVIHRAADAAHIGGVLLDHRYIATGFGEHVGGRQAGGTRADHENIGTLQLTRSTGECLQRYRATQRLMAASINAAIARVERGVNELFSFAASKRPRSEYLSWRDEFLLRGDEQEFA